MSALDFLPGFATMDLAEDAARIVAAGLDAEASAWEISPNPHGGFQVCITWSRQRYDAPQVLWIGKGKPHVRFTFAPMATKQLAIFYDPPPMPDFENMTVARGLRIPALIVGDHVDQPHAIAAKVCGLLNEHWTDPAEGEQE